MTLIKQTTLLLLLVSMITSCEKGDIKTTPLTSLAIVNAVNGGTAVRNGSNATVIANNSYAPTALIAGDNNLYIWPVGDSANPYFTTSKFTTNDREVYSLFLCGTPDAVDGITIKENIPYRTDSTAGIRFINLAPESQPLSITLAASPTVNEVTDLSYKNITEFKTYAGLYNSEYTFEIRDATTAAPADPLATFSLSAAQVPRFANITLVIRQNGTSVAVFRVNNDR
ncbi:MAG: hypothetical protein J7497_10740 [Chitinophagaceae bacterium]|nr:hypothetical protein [Chitinophagaceae bacterium]